MTAVLVLLAIADLARAAPPVRLGRVAPQVRQELDRAYQLLGPRPSPESRLHATRAFVRALGKHAPSLPGHVVRTAAYARVIARQMGLSARQVGTLDLAARLHDLGKLGVSPALLQSRGGLGARERATIQRHPELTGRLLQVPGMKRVGKIAAAHHENLAGTGYPRQRRGRQVPLLARILSVADVFDAITTRRSYHQGMPLDQALNHLREQSGSTLDPRVVQALCDVLPRSPVAQRALGWARRSGSPSTPAP